MKYLLIFFFLGLANCAPSDPTHGGAPDHAKKFADSLSIYNYTCNEYNTNQYKYWCDARIGDNQVVFWCSDSKCWWVKL